MGDHHAHAGSKEGGLRIALVLTFLLLIAELAGAFYSGSLALLSDAAHMMTDVTALVIALLAIRLGKRPADARRTYGYHRFEILAAMGNAVMLFLAAGYIAYEAVQRFRHPPPVASGIMLWIALAGLIANLISMFVLSRDKDHSINVKGAYLEVWSDALGSFGVLIGAAIIHWTGWLLADPIIAMLIALWVLPRAWALLSESGNVLLEGVPAGLTLDGIRAELAAIEGVADVHDLHVWSITTGRNTLTAHLSLQPEGVDNQAVLDRAREIIQRHGITHSTVQLETFPCDHEHEH